MQNQLSEPYNLEPSFYLLLLSIYMLQKIVTPDEVSQNVDKDPSHVF